MANLRPTILSRSFTTQLPVLQNLRLGQNQFVPSSHIRNILPIDRPVNTWSSRTVDCSKPRLSSHDSSINRLDPPETSYAYKAAARKKHDSVYASICLNTSTFCLQWTRIDYSYSHIVEGYLRIRILSFVNMSPSVHPAESTDTCTPCVMLGIIRTVR